MAKPDLLKKLSKSALWEEAKAKTAHEIGPGQKELVNSIQDQKFSPLHYACHRGNLQMAQLLLDYGADLHATSEKGVTCLHLAAVSGNLSLVKYLVDEKGLSPEITSFQSGSKPIHVATTGGNL